MEDIDESSHEQEISEKKFPKPEYIRRGYYLSAAIFALIVISILPTPEGLSTRGQRALGILAFVTILWVTEVFPLGLTALLGSILLPLLGIVNPSNAFIGFSSTALFFLMGGISFGIAMQKTNLHKRVALKFLQKFGKGSSRIMLGVCLLGGLMAFTMPAHAVAALLLPVLMGIVEAGEISQDENFGIAIFLALTYSTSVGSIATLLGGARNVLALGILERAAEDISVGFLEWVIAGSPIALILIFTVFIVLKTVYPWDKINASKIRSKLKEEVEDLGEVSVDEKKAGIIFTIAFVLWMTVGTRIGLATIAIGGLILLVATRTITWRNIEQNMPWGLLFLYGGALTLSNALSMENVESVQFLALKIQEFIGNYPLIVLISLLVLVLVISNLMSNSAATAVVLPIAIPTLMELGYPGLLPTYLIAMGSAMAFMLPIATPSAAIVYSSGYVEIKDLMKAGLVLSIISIIIFLTIGLGWWKVIGVW
ncbi:MAG: SLC13 family permease [Candidatus Hadarchaeia archaeon]